MSSYRLRIALALKKLEAEQAFVHLARNGCEQNAPGYRAINPQGRVPALELDDRTILIQSAVILEYLEEVYPTLLWPGAHAGRCLSPAAALRCTAVRGAAGSISAHSPRGASCR